MEEIGWIKIYRKLMDWEWYTNSQTVHLFLHLILSANTQEKKWQGITIGKGQLVTGRRTLSEATKIPVTSIHRILERLRSSGVIEIKTNNKGSIITICNYETYQCQNSQGGTQMERKRNANGTQTERTKEYKNIINISSSPSDTRALLLNGQKEANAKAEEEAEKAETAEMSEDEMFQQLATDQTTQERTCKSLGITPDQYQSLLQNFQDECSAMQKRHKGGYNDYRQHAYGWMRIRLEHIRREEKLDKERQTNQTNQTNQQSKANNHGSNGYYQQGRRLTPKEEWLKYEEERREKIMAKFAAHSGGADVLETISLDL